MAPSVRAAIIGLLAATGLSGCILFPPFFPIEPPIGEARMLVANETDADWVVSFGTDLPEAFAVAAGESGVATVFSGRPPTAALLDPDDCQPQGDPIELDADATGVRIGSTAELTAATGPVDEDLPRLAEYWDCSLDFGAAPTAGTAVPDATGTIRLGGSDGRPWVLEPADATLTPIGEPTDGQAYGEEFAWSPDGSTVAYTRYGGTTPTTSIQLVAADGSADEVLVGDAMSPAWSPDGTRIAFVDVDPFDGRGALSVVEVDAPAEPMRLSPSATSPRWSPDGTRIAFVAIEEADTFADTGVLSIVDVETGTVSPLSELDVVPGMFSWSPDGATMAFVAAAPQPDQILAVDVETGAHRTIGEVDGAVVSGPAWSPDGSQLAFVLDTSSLIAPTSAMAVTDADGEALHRVLTESSEHFYLGPAWSPDGRYLAVTRSGMTLTSELVLVPVEGGEPIVVATGAASVAGWVR